jgi:hypothetical protein
MKFCLKTFNKSIYYNINPLKILHRLIQKKGEPSPLKRSVVAYP